MRILHIGTEMQWRGGENQVSLLISELNKQNIKSVVTFPEKSKALLKFQEQGVEALGLKGKGGYHFRDALYLNQYCKNHSIDIIHCHSGKAHSLGYLMKVLGCVSKLIVHRRVAFPIRKSYLTQKKYLSKRVDHFLSISEAIKKDLLKYGVPEAKVSIARSSVDPSRFSALTKEKSRSEFNIETNTPVIGIVAALTGEKGHDTLFKALKNIETQYLCLVAGDGELKDSLNESVKSHKLEDKVKFLGFINNPEVLLSALDILVVPSRSEGLGSVALDGILANCLVIASEAGGLPEIVQDKKTGYLFGIDNSAQLNILLRECLQSNNNEIIGNAQKHVLENFSLEKMVETTLGVYQKAIQ